MAPAVLRRVLDEEDIAAVERLAERLVGWCRLTLGCPHLALALKSIT